MERDSSRTSLEGLKLKCPTCGKETVWEGNPWRPFCSENCKLIDLGKWLLEEYKIPEGKDEEDKSPGD